MSNVTVPNFTLAATNDTRSAIWKLSRGMKAAGWVTLASSDGTTKDTSGTYAGDKWNGTIGTGGTGAVASVSTVTNGVATLTGLTGFASGTAGQRWITITGAASGGNNGTFKILSFISSSSVTIRNAGAVAGDANNGAISWTERIPLSDTNAIIASSWIVMQGPSVLKIPISTLAQDGYALTPLGANQTGTAATIANVNGTAVTITGLTNMTFGSAGSILVVSGAANAANNGSFVISKFLSSTDVIISNPSGVAPDANSGSINWQEKLVSSGRRGEVVTQTTTGAIGEVVGIHFDVVTATGYLVVFPRNNGSGGGPFGWNGTDVITGATSGAVWTPIASPTEFIKEVVMWAGSANTQTMTGYMQTVDGYTESASRFSVLAGSAGATATIAPGGGGTGNTFPIPGSFVWVGTGGAKTDARFALTTWTGNLTNAQLMCADATFDVGRSADGSFTCAIGVPTNAGAYLGFVYTRLDDQEDGDVDPYIFYTPSNDTQYNPTRTALTGTYTAAGESFNANNTGTTSLCNLNTFRGWRRRGFFTTDDAFQNYQLGLLCQGSFLFSNTTGSGQAGLLQNTTDNEVVATSTVSTTTNTNSSYVSEPIWVISTQLGFRTMKGSCRWLRAVQGGTGTDTLGNGASTGHWYQLNTGSTVQIPFISGPWDATTTPVK
jgi:hypothetical protein